jgi:peptidoglycan/xylan/chitin deacetylase (PgdA/CDA1 family)
MTPLNARDQVSYAAKYAAANLLRASGALAAWKRLALRRRAVVLAYHRLLPEGAETWSHPGIIVTPATFERQMRLLQQHFRVLSLEEFEWHFTNGADFEPGSCLITFDDGWIDTYTTAWPMLKRFGIPAVVFVPTSFIGSTSTFWQEHLGMLVSKAGDLARQEPKFAAELSATLTNLHLGELFRLAVLGEKNAILAEVRAIKTNSNIDPGLALERIAALLGPHAAMPHGDTFFTWDAAREMSQGGISFGVHGHTHRMLNTLQPDDLGRELSRASEIIARELDRSPTSMSYPNGNFNGTVAEAVRCHGFRTAFSMERGYVEVHDNACALRRMNIHEGPTGSDALFLARILGLF